VPPDPEVGFEECLARLKDKRLPFTRMMASSDSNGSLPVFDDEGRLVRLTIATERDFFRRFGEIVLKGLVPLETAVRVFSTNAADFYKLGRKGRIEPGRDADILIVDGRFGLVDVFARGKRMVADGRVLARGTFSD
jgi:beta-aspartyl-dipeptidase (metallo-type)